MLMHPNGITPLINEDGSTAMFNTKEAADEAAKGTLLSEAFGHEVFCLGCGE